MTRRDWTLLAAVVVVVGLGASACGEDDPAAGFEQLDLAVCAPTGGPFTVAIDNPYFPLPVGHHLVLEGTEDGVALRVEITVLDQTEDVAGVTTRVVEEAEYENDAVVEISRNFFVQAPDGTVCYYGEDVDDYAGGVIVGHGGAWRAGAGGASPGIIMPGAPRAQTKFAQEHAPGIAEDMSAVMDVAASVTVPAGTYSDAMRLIDWDPLDGDTSGDGETKYYARDVGLVVDAAIRLTTAP